MVTRLTRHILRWQTSPQTLQAPSSPRWVHTWLHTPPENRGTWSHCMTSPPGPPPGMVGGHTNNDIIHHRHGNTCNSNCMVFFLLLLFQLFNLLGEETYDSISHMLPFHLSHATIPMVTCYLPLVTCYHSIGHMLPFHWSHATIP